MADVFITDIEQISEIDDSVEFVGDNGAKTYSVPASLLKKYTNKGLVNPNLLDNWYFVNPVNQRGKTEYVGNGYSIDRWKADNSGTTLSLTDNGCRLVMSAGNQFRQILEDYQSLHGSKLTGTILLADNTLLTGTITFDSENTNWNSKAIFFTKNGLRVLFTKNTGFDIYSDVAIDHTIVAIKLELGDTQTLAHQENGVWVLNEIPNYADQLTRCQRYYRQSWVGVMSGNGAVCFTRSTSTNSHPAVHWDVPMRATPSISIYSWGDIGLNSIRNWASSIDVAISGAAYVGTNGFAVNGLNANTKVGDTYVFHYTATADL